MKLRAGPFPLDGAIAFVTGTDTKGRRVNKRCKTMAEVDRLIKNMVIVTVQELRVFYLPRARARVPVRKSAG